MHIIDQVLTVPYNVSTTALAADLTALAGALEATNLLTTLDAAKDITVFAPNNAAFTAIGSAAGKLSVSALTSILEYHVIKGTVAYSSSLSTSSVKTLGGSDVNITVEGGAVFVNAARVRILIGGGRAAWSTWQVTSQRERRSRSQQMPAKLLQNCVSV